MANSPFEIPQTLRDLSEQTLKQSHAAYEQLSDFVTQAMDAWMGSMPANPVIAGFKDVQGRAMEIAMENAESAFTFAGKICNASTPQDIVTLQTQFAQERVQAFVAQTQQLFSLVGEVLRKPEQGAWTGAIPSNLLPSNAMVTGFKGVQDCAVAMAKKNAESAVALVDKIAKAQNFQEVLTLQTGFAQDQMNVFIAQAQELQKLTEDALQKQVRG